MSFLKTLFGPRWTLTLLHGQSEQRYALHGNSVYRIVGLVMHFYRNGAVPNEPWLLWLFCNKTKSGLLLESAHFTSDGENVTSELITAITSIDPGFRVPGDEPIFEECRTRRRIPLHGESIIDRLNAGYSLSDLITKEETFYSIMSDIFGHNR